MKVDPQLTPRGGLILGDAGHLTGSLMGEGGGREVGAREVTETVEKDPERRVAGGR